MGVYMYPADSINYDECDYGNIIDEINYWLNKGFLPYIGGDFNSRIGDISKISNKSLKWRYSDNVDQHTNLNCNNFSNMCEMLKVLPLNHCIYIKIPISKETGHTTKRIENHKLILL